MLVKNQLTLSNGEQVVFSSTQLQANQTGCDASRLRFLVNNVQQGYFTFTGNNNLTRLTIFSQAQLTSGLITFLHAGNGQAPIMQWW